MQLTVDEAAELAGVHAKTMREWIVRDGVPLIREGSKGPNQGAVIDGARFPGWLHTKRFNGSTLGDRLQEIKTLPNGANAFKWLAEYEVEQMLAALAVAWRLFLDDGAWRDWGLTEDQARTVTWRAWAWGAQWMKVYLVDGFEAALKRDIECDLDDLGSFLFQTDFRTKWSKQAEQIDCPSQIAELVPDDVRARLAEAERAEKVRPLSTRRGKKRNGHA